MQNIILFEDQKYSQFSPLTYLRPIYDLRCGINLLKDKIVRQYSDAIINLFCRNEIAEVVSQKSELAVNNKDIESGLLLNGRIICHDLSEKIESDGDDTIYKNGDEIVAVRFSNNNQLKDLIDNDGILNVSNCRFPIVEIDVEFVEFPWDLVYKNGDEIRNDFKWYFQKSSPQILGNIYEGVAFLNEDQIYVGQNSILKPGVVLDAEEGPILIGNDVTIMPNSVIVGPAFIGDNSVIKTGAKINEDTSIGEVCKVGGEVESCIFQSNTNKQHEGFLGHSYLGSWINIGADTNNSDLKNNYKNISVTIHKKEFDTGKTLFGLIMGDHSKTAINTMFNTGTVIGVCCNIFGTGFPLKSIPSFSWGGFDNNSIYNSEKAIETAKIVMKRRNDELSDSESALLKNLFLKRELEI